MRKPKKPKSKGLCDTCTNMKDGLPDLACNHLAVQSNREIGNDPEAKARGYARIRQALGLEFEPSSWCVKTCGGYNGCSILSEN